MNAIYGRIGVLALCALVATACVAQREQSTQHEAVEYQVQQHDSAKCADLGLLPGSDEFNTCMARLGGGIQSPPR